MERCSSEVLTTYVNVQTCNRIELCLIFHISFISYLAVPPMHNSNEVTKIGIIDFKDKKNEKT
jgi:glutamyl-tRNA reductase